MAKSGDTIPTGAAPENKDGPIKVDSKIQPYIDMLRESITKKNAQKLFDDNQVILMATSLEKNRFGIYNVTNTATHYTKSCIDHMIDNAIDYSQNPSAPTQNKFAKFLENPPKDFARRMGSVVTKGLAGIVRTQDMDQMYHTILHGLEMYYDSRHKIGQLTGGNNNSPIAIFGGALACYHDIVQGQGQYENEKRSAEEFYKIFAEEFKEDFKNDPNTLVSIEKASKDIIVEGTLLNINFPAARHTPLLVIQHDLLNKIEIKIPANSAQETIELVAGVLSSNDVHRAANNLSFDGTLELEEMPPQFKTALRATLLDGLKKSGDFDLTTKDAETFLDKFFPSFEILIGQNVRMMADGPVKARKFQDNDMDPVNLTIDVTGGTEMKNVIDVNINVKDSSKLSSMSMLKNLFDGARLAVANGESKTYEAQLIANAPVIGIVAGALGGEGAFGKGMDSLEIAKMYENDNKNNLSKALKDQMILTKVKNQDTHAWAAHAKYFLPTLSNALKANPTLGKDLVGGMIFCAANQAGFNKLCNSPELLADLFQDIYKVDLPKNISTKDSRLAATAFMSLSQDPQAKKLLTEYKENDQKSLAALQKYVADTGKRFNVDLPPKKEELSSTSTAGIDQMLSSASGIKAKHQQLPSEDLLVSGKIDLGGKDRSREQVEEVEKILNKAKEETITHVQSEEKTSSAQIKAGGSRK